jgi:effector-binding domain-containing protein
MLEKPWVIQVPEQHVAMIRLVVTPEEMQTVMGPGIEEIFRVVSAQGLTPSGPWFNHHFAAPSSVFDFGICVPTPTPIVAEGRVVPNVRPASQVVRTNYHGPYEGLGNAWQQFMELIAADNLQCTDDFWECYTRGPESESDSQSFVTELNRPLHRLGASTG